MNFKKSTLLKILIFLFAFNLISLIFYFSSHPDHNFFLRKPQSEGRKFLTENHQTSQFPFRYTNKHWPDLPSRLPWSRNPNVPFRSCEAYFGNGFTRRLDLLGNDDGGWFRCYFSETLRSSVCEGGKIRMNPEKIKMSKGGEKLEEVIGREEDSELPEFEIGAFEIEGSRKGESKFVNKEILDEYVPAGEISRHTMRSLIDSIQIVGNRDFKCDQWVEEPTLLVTRYEYANLFHTITDWYTAYVASRVTGLPDRPHLVFVDGHCETQLEETWKALFSSLKYAKNFSGSVCFRHAILVPLGYETALFKGLTEEVDCQGTSANDLRQNSNDKKTARLSEFGEMIKAVFGLSTTNKTSQNILFIRREDYLAHPRHGGKVQSRLSNEEEVFDSIKNWVSNNSQNCNLTLVNGLFAHMPMKEQVRAIQDASVIIGAHGAGLTHIVSATEGTIILEIISSEFMRPHFRLIAEWKGLEYHAINLAGSYADCDVVLGKLSRIMKSLGC